MTSVSKRVGVHLQALALQGREGTLTRFLVSHFPEWMLVSHSLAFLELLLRVRDTGMMPDDMHRLMLWCAAQLPFGDGHIVEIGSYKGGSSVYLAKPMCLNNDPYLLYCVDTFKGYGGHEDTLAEFHRNLARADVTGKVVAIQNTSEFAGKNWVNGPIRLLFIDALHTYEAVKQDFETWSPFLIPGGGLIFHDYNDINPGVKQFVDELILAGIIAPLEEANGMLLARK